MNDKYKKIYLFAILLISMPSIQAQELSEAYLSLPPDIKQDVLRESSKNNEEEKVYRSIDTFRFRKTMPKNPDEFNKKTKS